MKHFFTHTALLSERNTLFQEISKIINAVSLQFVFVGPCHHVITRPQVADGGMVSDMEGSYE